MECPDSELSILLVDDPQIAALNRDYRQRAGPTNVIAFAMREGAFAEVAPDLLGDVVISADAVAREAQELALTFSRRFDELLIHGILHLVGFDHEQSESEASRMEHRTRELLRAIGAESDLDC
ncbi:MAG: rRNA maturation RNase YbeY [Desulfobacterales bacterium]